MEVLITGSSGFVGTELTAAFLKKGHAVFGLDRVEVVSPASKNFNAIKVDLTKRSFEYPKIAWDLVIHCAAAKGDWNISEEEFNADNVVATENLIHYLYKCDVKKFIHFSTVAIYSRSVTDGSENTKIEPDSVYGQTKLESEILVRKFAKETGITTVILRPSVIYGRNNYANMFNLIQQLNRAFPFQINPVGITKSHVSVRNVVDVVLRFSNPSYSVNGLEIYNLTERPYNDLNKMISIICDELRVKPPKVNLPIWLVAVPFGILEYFGKLLKKDTGFTLDRLRKFSSSTHYTSEKLWSQTGNQKYSSESELRDMVKWFKEREK
jgi:nucleoside-diphosphate-sugar epimerase